MKPWEQHSRVISLPRFNYTASSSLLQHSHSGFLVTCNIKREKSATKEVISILEKHAGSINSCNPESLECFDEIMDAKRRKISTEGINENLTNDMNVKIIEESTNVAEGDTTTEEDASASKIDFPEDKGPALSLVKLTRSGLILFIFPRNNTPDTVGTVSIIMKSLESGSLKSPSWCNRILPIQATCNLNEKELHAVVIQLVVQFINDRGKTLEHPIKFAIGYNRRGIQETEMKNSDLFALLDRNKCLSVVAGAVKEVLPDSVADLKTPELSILVELLPLSGIPSKSLVAAISVLPLNLISTKPRLCVKALVSNANSKTGMKF